MDPNYHYFVCGEGTLYLRGNVPCTAIGLGDGTLDGSRPIAEAFYTYTKPFSRWNPYEENTDKYIEFLLRLDAEKAKHICSHGGEFRIGRVPKELEEYTDVDWRSFGCCGIGREICVEIDISKAIIDLTKKTLENPTPDAIAHLTERIAFFEAVKIEDVQTPFLEYSVHSDQDDSLQS